MHARDTLVWHCADMLLPAVQCSAAVVQLTRNCDAEAIMPSDGMGSKEWFNDQLCDLALQFELSWPAAGDVWYHLATTLLCAAVDPLWHMPLSHMLLLFVGYRQTAAQVSVVPWNSLILRLQSVCTNKEKEHVLASTQRL